MPKFEQIKRDEQNEDFLYSLREKFIKENYPAKESSYDIEELIGSGLDGMEVLEKKDKSGELVGIASYFIAQDHNKMLYLSIGILLTREESRGEGVMKELLSQIERIAKREGCEYITAVADTEAGDEFLSSRGFDWERDPINGREHLRFDL